MCGINGLINIGSKEVFDIMNQEISHRGPDDYGSYWFEDVNSGIAHHRLSIIDLSSAGKQLKDN